MAAIGGGNPRPLSTSPRCSARAVAREETLPAAPPADGALGRAYRARLDRLPPETRRMLLLAALDEDGELGTLIRAAGAAGTEIDALAPAEVAGLVRVEPRGVTFPSRWSAGWSRPAHRSPSAAQPPTAGRGAGSGRATAAPGDAPGRRVGGADPALAAELEQAAAGGANGWAAASAALRWAAELSDHPKLTATRLLTAARYAWAGGQPDVARLLLDRLRAVSTDPVDRGAPTCCAASWSCGVARRRLRRSHCWRPPRRWPAPTAPWRCPVGPGRRGRLLRR
ncbi:hypothetical protein NKG94_06710 [Micromonospora sp. M12]